MGKRFFLFLFALLALLDLRKTVFRWRKEKRGGLNSCEYLKICNLDSAKGQAGVFFAFGNCQGGGG
jgi:hypothetical protein